MLSNCAGWQKATFKRATYEYLATKDKPLLLATISNNENGAESGCWKRTRSEAKRWNIR